jgi:hypothetical protein
LAKGFLGRDVFQISRDEVIAHRLNIAIKSNPIIEPFVRPQNHEKAKASF